MQRRNIALIALLTVLPACPGESGSTVEPTASMDGSTGRASETSGTEDTGAESGSTGVEAPELAGRWLSACFAQPDGTHANLDFDLTPARWALDYRVHADEACETRLVTVHIEGPYVLEGPSAVADAWDGVFSFDAKTITPHAQPLVDALDEAGCGSEAWAVDGTQSIEDGCAAFGQYPIADCGADYDLVAREGDTLRFGLRPADNDMCSPERRPSELSPVEMTLQ